jgi:glycosyltransferase involved in cell wall biosynthesis
VRLSFIIPAHDEEAALPATLAAIRRAAADAAIDAEIVVVDDDSTDATAQIAGDSGARVVRIASRQIAAARNAGAAAAGGDLFLFVDADTRIDARVLIAAVAALEKGAVGGGATVRFDEPAPLYARLMIPAAIFTTRLFRVASGCFLFCTRAAFAASGGFDETVFAAEEVLFSRALARQGRLVFLRERVVTSGRKLRTHSARQIVGTLLRLAVSGKRGLADRRRLDLWYGPRRADPRALDRELPP